MRDGVLSNKDPSPPDILGIKREKLLCNVSKELGYVPLGS